jgi:hypothetical protein
LKFSLAFWSKMLGVLSYDVKPVSAVGTLTGLRNKYSEARFPPVVRNCSLLQNVYPCSGAHRDTYSTGTGSLPREQMPGQKTDQGPRSGFKVKNEWTCTSTSPLRPNALDRDDFTFLYELLPSSNISCLFYLSLRVPSHYKNTFSVA